MIVLAERRYSLGLSCVGAQSKLWVLRDDVLNVLPILKGLED